MCVTESTLPCLTVEVGEGKVILQVLRFLPYNNNTQYLPPHHILEYFWKNSLLIFTPAPWSFLQITYFIREGY